MNKFISLVVLTGAVACGGVYDESIGSLEAPMSAYEGSGWVDNDGWEHRACDLNNSNHVCYFPAARTDGQGKYRRLVNMPLTDSGLPSGVTATVSRNSMMSMLMNQTQDWTFVSSSQGLGANYRIVRDDTIYNGTPPNTSILLSSIAHISCSEYGQELVENYPASTHTCKQVTLALDVDSFTAWVNQWCTSAAQKQNVLTSIFVHGGGVALGVPARDATLTPTASRRTLTKTSTPISLSSYGACLADVIWYDNPDVEDPNFTAYPDACP